MLEKWVQHFLGVAVTIRPLQKVDDEAWRWHVGLDIDATALLNDLYEGREVEAERMQRLVSLFRLDFADPQEMRADVAGKPVYLGLMMNADRRAPAQAAEPAGQPAAARGQYERHENGALALRRSRPRAGHGHLAHGRERRPARAGNRDAATGPGPGLQR